MPTTQSTLNADKLFYYLIGRRKVTLVTFDPNRKEEWSQRIFHAVSGTKWLRFLAYPAKFATAGQPAAQGKPEKDVTEMFVIKTEPPSTPRPPTLRERPKAKLTPDGSGATTISTSTPSSLSLLPALAAALPAEGSSASTSTSGEQQSRTAESKDGGMDVLSPSFANSSLSAGDSDKKYHEWITKRVDVNGNRRFLDQHGKEESDATHRERGDFWILLVSTFQPPYDHIPELVLHMDVYALFKYPHEHFNNIDAMVVQSMYIDFLTTHIATGQRVDNFVYVLRSKAKNLSKLIPL